MTKKTEALRYASNVFDGYSKHHEAKGDIKKREQNEIHAQVMLDALAEQTIRENLIVEPTVSNSLKVDALRLTEEALDAIELVLKDGAEHGLWPINKNCEDGLEVLPIIRAALVDTNDISEKRVDKTPVCGHEPVAYIRRDQLQKALISTGLCEVSAEPRKDRIRIYTAPVEPAKQEPVGISKTETTSDPVNFDAKDDNVAPKLQPYRWIVFGD